MYLKKIVCQSMGPISHLDIEPSFNANGTPKPLIIVGKNGTGKSILISNIADAFFEFGDQAYNDLTRKVFQGHSYFKLTGSNQVQIGKEGMICFLKFSAETNPNESPEYLYRVGNIDFDAFDRSLPDKYKVTVGHEKDKPQIKKTCQKGDLFKEELRKSLVIYFPPERFSIPYWLCKAYSTSHEYSDIGLQERFSGNLYKPIIADDTTAENTKWMIDVVVDSRCGLRYDGQTQNFFIHDHAVAVTFQFCKENIETVLSEIIEETVKLDLGFRNSGKSRIVLKSALSGNKIAPTLDALSSGQMMLLNIFLTIIRYADTTDISKSIALNEISGMVVIDEIEMHLHSDLQRKVLPSLIKLFPKVQFIITSHSPLFLLGMQEKFSDTGFDIYEMPDGEKISPESFSEFGKAYDAVSSTDTYRRDLEDAIKKRIVATEKALIITEGATDWKHLKRAWSKLKNNPAYAPLIDRFEFLEYEPVNRDCDSDLKLSMGSAHLQKMCQEFSKLRQPRKIIFIADRDVPEIVKEFSGDNGFRHYIHGNLDTNVFSFVIPVPQHRSNQNNICIEHYYSDAEIRTPKSVNGINRRIFTGDEFNDAGFGIESADKYYCNTRNICGPDKISVIDGSNNVRVTLKDENGQGSNYALPKMEFAEAILNEDGEFANISSDNFSAIFDVLLQIIAPLPPATDQQTSDAGDSK